MIYIYTHAYNANKTLPRAIESILNQTNGNFIWQLCDNASTDDTKEVILRYAQKDTRIVPEFRDINHLHPDYKGSLLFWLPALMSFCKNGNDEDFFCTLDADDEYKPDFFDKMLCFIRENDLEVAACGNDFIDASTNAIVGQRILQQNLIFDSSIKFDVHFPEYHQFMRPVWGKLYRLSLLKRCDYENYINAFDVPYGLDTLFCMRAFLRAERAGIFAEPLLKYYISPKSSSHNFDSKRIISDQILDNETRTFLIEKTGRISFANDRFLNLVYFNAALDSLKVLLNSQVPSVNKINFIKDIIISNNTQALFQSYTVGKDELERKIRFPVIRFLLSMKECRKPDIAKIASEIIMAMYDDLQQMVSQDGLIYIILKMPEMVEYLLKKDYKRIIERLHKWYKRHDADNPSLTGLEISAYSALGKPDEELFLLLINIKKSRPQSLKFLDIDSQICNLIERYPLLKNMSADLATTFSTTICWVIKTEYRKALDAFISEKQVDINDDDIETYILFGQNLSAAVENTDIYLYFKKVWISYLLDCSRVLEAEKELDEFQQILPDDEDFIELRKRLG